MGGLAIVILTLLAVGLFALVCWASFGTLSWLNWFYNDTPVSEKALTKVLLLIPYIFVAMWCGLLYIVLFVATLGGVVSLANAFRGWWHKGA